MFSVRFICIYVAETLNSDLFILGFFWVSRLVHADNWKNLMQAPRTHFSVSRVAALCKG